MKTLAILILSVANLHATPLARDGKALLPIVISDKAAASTKTDARELADYLGRISGATFEITTGDGSSGIVLGTAAEFPSLKPEGAKEFAESREAFAIRSEDKRLLLIGSSELATPDAVFALLEQLGCRWFFPGDTWTIIPKQRDLVVQLDRVVRPAFRMRGFFGSGGFGPPNPVDPKLTFRDKWDAWKRHNLFGGEFIFAGHAGEAFSLANKAALEAHPEYRAMIKGERLPWALGVKPCASNPEAVKLYVEDRLKSFRLQLKTDPTGTRSFAVSVEPSDGGNHCECPDCVKIGTVSDRAFYLANQVAKAVAKEMPGHAVSLYAYNEHAAPPSIPLEPNVYVTLIPYGFQRTGMTGDELIAEWKQKVPRMSLYDYWSIPDWENNLPTFDFAKRAADRIRYWQDHGVEGLSNESTFSAGAMGLGWYVSSRLLWDPNTNESDLIAEFMQKCFGPARPPMQRMLERWTKGFLLTDHELGLSYRDLNEARKLAASDAAISARLDDYTAYLHYLRLWYEYQEAKPGTAERKAKARELVTFIWRIYHTCMVQTFRMHQLIANRYEKDTALINDYDMKNADAPGWKTATPATATELAALMADGMAKYQPLDFETREFTGPLTPRPTGPTGTFSPPMRMASTTEFEVEALPGMQSLPIKIQVANKPGMADQLTVWNADGTVVFKQALPADGELKELQVPMPKPGRYRLRIFDQKTLFTLQLPSGVPLVTRSFLSPDLSPRVYFHVPKGLTKLAMHVPGAIPIKLFDGDGKAVTYQGAKLIVATVPPGQDDRMWSFSGYKAWVPIKMLTAPQVFSFFADTMMVPDP